MTENRDALRIWSLVQDQVIVGFDSVISLNHLAVWKDIEEYEKYNYQINKWEVFEKIVKVFSKMRIKEKEKSNKKNEEKYLKSAKVNGE